MNFPLASSSPSALGFAQEPLDQLARMIEGHIRDGRYPGDCPGVAPPLSPPVPPLGGAPPVGASWGGDS